MSEKIPIVYLEWIDAYGNSDWFSSSQVEAFIEDDCWMKEVGFLIRETSKYIIFAQRVSGYNNVYKILYGSLHKIPKTWIRKRKILGHINLEET